MPISRIRGGTPTEYQITNSITDPQILAQLDALNRSFRARRTQELKEDRRKMLEEYQPPPHIRTPDRELSTLNLPSPLPSPPHSLYQLATTHPTPPSTSSPQSSRPTPPSAEQSRPKTATTHVLESGYRRASPPPAMTTRSRTTPHTVFLELSGLTGCARRTIFRAVAPRPNNRAQAALPPLNHPKQLTNPRASGVVKKRAKAGAQNRRVKPGTRAVQRLAGQEIS
ncbi:MAG: hypothetical protein Q9210_004443 [Variospora velana]